MIIISDGTALTVPGGHAAAIIAAASNLKSGQPGPRRQQQ